MSAVTDAIAWFEASESMLRVTHGNECAEEAMEIADRLRDEALAKQQIPWVTCGACAGLCDCGGNDPHAVLSSTAAPVAVAVDDAMVERAQIAWMQSDFVNVPGDSDEFDELVRLLLTAGFTPE